MTTLQKAIIATILTAAVGTGIYESRQASFLQTEVQGMKQQQATLTEQVEQLTRERDRAKRQITALRDENQRLNNNTDELLRLRGEVTQLRRQNELLKSQDGKAATPPVSEPKAAQKTDPHEPGAYITKEQLADVGRATPEAALETITWAMTKGTYKQNELGLSPDLRAQEAQDPKARQNFEARQAQFAPFLKGMQIVAKKILADDRVELKVKQDIDPAMEQFDTRWNDFKVQPMVRINGVWMIGGNTRSYRPNWESDGQIQTFVP